VQRHTLTQYSSVKHFFLLFASYPAVSRFASTLKKLTLTKSFSLNPSVLDDIPVFNQEMLNLFAQFAPTASSSD
jgi:hypothetical protein